MKVTQNYHKDILSGYRDKYPILHDKVTQRTADLLGIIEEDDDTYIVYRLHKTATHDSNIYIERLVDSWLDLVSPNLEFVEDDELWSNLVKCAMDNGILSINKDDYENK